MEMDQILPQLQEKSYVRTIHGSLLEIFNQRKKLHKPDIPPCSMGTIAELEERDTDAGVAIYVAYRESET